MNGFDYISTINSQEEDDAWDKEISTGFMGRPDGGYSLRGWSLTGADPKHDSHNNGLSTTPPRASSGDEPYGARIAVIVGRWCVMNPSCCR
jgi:hypothetical protein